MERSYSCEQIATKPWGTQRKKRADSQEIREFLQWHSGC
jgi:hypothetical protein